MMTQGQPSIAKMTYRPFYLVYDSVMNEFKGTGTVVDFSVIVRVFFVVNIIGIAPMAALENMLNRALNRPVKTEAQNIMIQISSEKFTPEQFANTIQWLVTSGIMTVDSPSLDKEISFHKQKDRTTSDIMKVYTMQIQKSGRPSLFQISQSRHSNMILAKDQQGSATSTYDGYYTFDGFTHRMRFPNSMSTYMQQRAYWLVSQQEFFKWQQYAHDFLPKELASALLQYGSVQSPEPGTIYDVLQNTVIVGAPFPALQQFHRTCLRSLPGMFYVVERGEKMTGTNVCEIGIERISITMNEVFRLYVASYQYKGVWKDVWKLVKPILSVQIIKDVEVFVQMNEMDSYSTASIMLYGSSEPPHGAMFCGKRHVSSYHGEEGEVDIFRNRRGSEYSTTTVGPSDSVSCCGGGDIMTCSSNNRQSASALAASKVLLRQRKKRPERYEAVATGAVSLGSQQAVTQSGGGTSFLVDHEQNYHEQNHHDQNLAVLQDDHETDDDDRETDDDLATDDGPVTDGLLEK